MKKRTLILLTFILAMALLGVVDAQAGGCNYHDRGQCVPGLITNETWWTAQPEHVKGKAVWYAPNIMEATAEWRGMSLEGFAGGVALMSPAEMGEVVWLKRPGFSWEGPFLVVDASARVHMWVTVTHIGEVVEVDWNTARRWGMVSGSEGSYTVNEWMIRDVEVWKGALPPAEGAVAVDYPAWFETNVLRFDAAENPNRIWRMHEMRYAAYSDYKHDLLVAQAENQVAVANSKTAALADVEVHTNVYAQDTDLKYELSASVTPTIPFDYAKTMVISRDYGIESGFELLPEGFDAAVIDWNVAYSLDTDEVAQVETGCGIDDGVYENGYEDRGHCVEGLITEDSWYMRYPQHTAGAVTYYAEGIMGQVVENRGLSLKGYVDGIVLMSCAHVGESVWVRRSGGWEGPYLVVDCSHRYHLWVTLVQNHVNAEVSYNRWVKWAESGGTQAVEICIGSAGCSGVAYPFWSYWQSRYEFE
jgi:hypothetical protein